MRSAQLRKRPSLALVLVAVSSCLWSACQSEYSRIRSTTPIMFRGEQEMWNLVAEFRRPQYPSDSARLGSSGVVVSSTLVGHDGSVFTTRILEAPDRQIATSVIQALSQSRFRSPPDLPPGAVIEGKLTYYFDLTPTGPRVVTSPERIKLRKGLAVSSIRDSSVMLPLRGELK